MIRRRLLPIAAALVCAFSALVVVTDAAARDVGADGRFEKRTSSHFVLYQDVDINESSGLRGSRAFEQQVLETLESAYDRLDEYLGLRPPRPITVLVYDPQIFDTRFAPLFKFSTAGFYHGTVHVRGGTRVSDNMVRVLHHELVHAALDAQAPSLEIPAWVNEGLAEWFDARAVGQRLMTARQQRFLMKSARLGQLFPLAQLSRPSFGHLGQDAAFLAYLESHAFFEFLVRHHGQRSLREFSRTYMRTRNLERSIQRTYGADLKRLEKQFTEELGQGSRL